VRQQGGMKTSIAWSPAAGLNVASVERREGVGGHGAQPAADLLPAMRRTVQIAPQHLLANVPGSIRSRSARHCSGPSRALEVSKRHRQVDVWSVRETKVPQLETLSQGAATVLETFPETFRQTAKARSRVARRSRAVAVVG
jgi:hypothetical protein